MRGGEKVLRHAIQTASKYHIPAGFRADHKPSKSREISALENRYEDLRQQDPDDPDLENLGAEIRIARNTISREKWTGFVKSLGRWTNPQRFWQVPEPVREKGISTAKSANKIQ